MREIDNCVVCGKYLKDIGEQEQGMCNSCDLKTEEVSKKQLKEWGEKIKSFKQ